ncbi:MAG: hypothetical protein ACRCXT_05080, partial [Paraclostridium sp.]
VKDIFKSLSEIENINMYTVSSIILHSIIRVENLDEEVIEKNFIDSTGNISLYIDSFEYIKSLLDKCIPNSEKYIDDIDDLFEDYETDEKDWDFDYMEYIWYSILKRQDDFYRVTPKNFFKQMDIWKSMNNVKEDNVSYL